MTDQLPEDLVDHEAPDGTPTGAHARKHSGKVYCWHPDGKGGWVAIEWTRQDDNWYPDDQLFKQHPGHDIPARDVGVIARVCGELVSGTNDPRCAPSAEIRAWAAAQPEETPEADMPDPT